MASPLVRAVLVALLAGATALPVSAQRRELSVPAGATFTGASGPRLESVSSRLGFVAGVGLRLPRSSRIAFQTEFLIVHRQLIGERAPSTASPQLVGPRADHIRLTYFEVPLMLRFQRPYHVDAPVRPFLVLGPSFAFRVFCDREIRDEGGTVRDAPCDGTAAGYAPSLFHDLDIGVQAGVGLDIRSLGLFVRFTRSFRNLAEPSALPSSPFDGAKLWSVSAGVDYLVKWF